MNKLDTIRLSENAKGKMMRLKNRTGIQNWNVLCRWAFAVSIADKNKITAHKESGWSNVEMTWRTFGGVYEDVYWALLLKSAADAGLGVELSDLSHHLHLHLERGLATLELRVKKLEDFGDLVSVA
jgi:DNA sulfur modification protein DndE